METHFHITVTTEDIDNAKATSFDCPIALATKRAAKTELVMVGHTKIIVDMRSYLLPLEAINFITLYDSGVKPPTFEFKLGSFYEL